MTKQPWHRGSYPTRAARVVAAARADPRTRCWRCGRTLPQHPPHKNGRPAFWTAGHVHDSHPDSPLLPEASTCNTSHGASYGNRKRRRRNSRPW